MHLSCPPIISPLSPTVGAARANIALTAHVFTVSFKTPQLLALLHPLKGGAR